ncbi:MAG: GNAT family N-acetyltransferase [Muribaculaceae bacterium]
MLIRTVTPDDAEDICEIYNPFVTDTDISFETEPLSPAAMRSRIADLGGRYPWFVAEDEVSGRIIGFCYAHAWKGVAAYNPTLETTIYVSPSAARSGAGRALMSALENECRRRGYKALIACITATNSVSITFHEAIGFHHVSCFKGVATKFGRLLDVVDLQLTL